jgi:hypothetical protein
MEYRKFTEKSRRMTVLIGDNPKVYSKIMQRDNTDGRIYPKILQRGGTGYSKILRRRGIEFTQKILQRDGTDWGVNRKFTKNLAA